LAIARQRRQKLLPHCSELAAVRAELQKLVADVGVADRTEAQGSFSRSQTERLLLAYLSDGEAASWTRRVLDWRDVSNSYQDDDAGLARMREAGLQILKSPRMRNVFGREVAVPSRGKRDRSQLPRGSGPAISLMSRRADLQRAMRLLSPRAGQVLFLRAVADLEFKQVGGILDISAQAAHKAYAKALGDLVNELNGLSEYSGPRTTEDHTTALARSSELAELQGRQAELSVVPAELAFWERRAERMEGLLRELRPRLGEALEEVEHQNSRGLSQRQKSVAIGEA
jgi:hypothetical protein